MRRITIAAAALCALTACGAASSAGAPGGAPSGSPAPSTPAISAGPGTPLVVSEAQNGTTQHASRGATVTVVLHSTYWHIGGSSNQTVLRLVTGEQPSPSPGYIPGAGCGTVSETFIALADGTATVGATRTTCGEAVRCIGTEGIYRVTIIVTG